MEVRVRVAGVVAALVVAMVASSCTGVLRRTLTVFGLGSRYETGISADELAVELGQLASRFIVGVVSTAEGIEANSDDREIRRRALVWKLNVVPLVQRSSTLGDPQASFVAMLTLATGQRKYLAEGDGARLFGPLQGSAVAEAVHIEEQALATGATFLSPTQLEGIRWQVEDLTWKYPIRGLFQVEAATSGFAQSESSGAFDWVVSIPLSPFRALEGVDTGAQAIREFNATAREFAGFVAQLPELLRWQVELLLYDIERRDTTTSGLAAFERLAESSETLAKTAQALPADVGAQVRTLLEQVESQQETLRATVAEVRGTFTDLDATMARGTELSHTLLQLADRLDRVGTTWQAVIGEVRGPEPRTGAPEGRPFDILEYERTAAQLERTVVAVHGLVTELQTTGGGVGALANAIVWRLVVVVAAVFALRLGFRRLEARLARRDRRA